MRVFIGFGYNPRDEWIKTLVFPLVKAFGHEIETGEDLVGQPIEDGAGGRIDRSHAVIGFLTRRGDGVDGVWSTHRWVSDELARAAGKDLLIIEVREAGVDPQGGILGNRQRLSYDEKRREEFLVELVEALGRWPRGAVRLQLIGDNIQQLVPLLRRDEFQCQYRFHVDGEETESRKVNIQPLKGGLLVDVKNVPPSGFIQIEIRYKDRMWVSQFESLESHNIALIEG